MDAENALLQEDTTHNTPVKVPGNPQSPSQDSETPSMAQQLATLNIGCDKEDLTRGGIDTETTQEIEGSD